ncbi:DUF998 domain-containing protein [Aquimarina sp. RZ0]|uniref:DUF998 domain-containing protein n=1 Tax=Aquimarina sp. RZ0 TaxID=2607730 RepID=UPI0011F1CEE5|nr:DUF998 domain-containing protein [Aquimarina sp. RZ0]KAA1247541.1 DUF998 domain-containing protein [Aquimarina sp. RZ0]
MKQTKSSYLFFLIIYAMLLLAAFILPFFTDREYSLLKNTLSELGAQNTPYNWIMNFIFILLGFITFINGFKILHKHHLQTLLLLVFCISLVLTGIFLSAPLNRELVFDSFQNEMHAIFSTINGVSFFIYALSISFIARWSEQKMASIVIGIIVLILSYSIFIHSGYRGIYHRGIFIIAFGWILYSFKFYEFTISKKEYFKILNRKSK